jgi:hypothetical protein
MKRSFGWKRRVKIVVKREGKASQMGGGWDLWAHGYGRAAMERMVRVEGEKLKS